MAHPEDPRNQKALSDTLSGSNPQQAPQIKQAIQEAAKQSEGAKGPDIIKSFLESIGKTLGLSGGPQGPQGQQDAMHAGTDPRAPDGPQQQAQGPGAPAQPPPPGGREQPGQGPEQPEAGAPQRRAPQSASLRRGHQVGGHSGASASAQLLNAVKTDPTGRLSTTRALAKTVHDHHIKGPAGAAAAKVLAHMTH